MARLTRLLPAAALIALAACSDGTSPSSVNPQQLSGKLVELAGTFEDNGAFTSLLVLSSHFPNYGGTALLANTLPLLQQRDRGALRRMATGLASLSGGPGGVQALFPANVLTRTLEWNTQTNSYVIGNQTGAPANGIRVLIYFVDLAANAPAMPLNQIGYVDLTDESTAQFNRLGVLLKLFGQTVADYDITETIQTNFSELAAVGRLHSADLGEYADFDLSTGQSLDGSTFATAQNITGSDGTHLMISHDGDLASENVQILVGAGGNELQVNVNINSADVHVGSVLYNGTLVATISGTAGSIGFRGTNGNEIPPEDSAALGVILFRAVALAVVLTTGVLGPARIVF